MYSINIQEVVIESNVVEAQGLVIVFEKNENFESPFKQSFDDKIESSDVSN